MTAPSMSPDERVAALEAAIGHVFSDKALVLRALTHPSAVEDNLGESFERLEFLGDAVLGFIIAEEVYRRFPHLDEGGMTRVRISVVAGTRLSAVARELGIGEALRFGESEVRSGMRGRKSALEDVYEAITAALYLDAGIDVARDWVLKTLGRYIDEGTAISAANPKSVLQELVQARAGVVEYRVTGHTGPPHDRTFTCVAVIDGVVAGEGSGRSKREAEAAAAAVALDAFEGPGATAAR